MDKARRGHCHFYDADGTLSISVHDPVGRRLIGQLTAIGEPDAFNVFVTFFWCDPSVGGGD